MAARKEEELEDGAGSAKGATTEHVAICYDALVAHFLKQRPPKETFPCDERFPFFVTWKKRYGGRRGRLDLRGCIGNLSPQPLTRLKEYALTSALKDTRFDPMVPRELKDTTCAVSLLVNYEEARGWDDWTVGKHGIVINFGFTDGTDYSATYLPEVASEQRWTHKQAIDSLVRKAGYKGKVTKELRAAIQLTRYQSSKAALSYDEWRKMRGLRDHPV